MEYTKDIRYNAADGDYAYLLDGEILGYAPTRLQAEQKLNAIVYDLLARPTCSAADLTPEDAADVLAAVDPATAFLIAEEARDFCPEAIADIAAAQPRRSTVRILATIDGYDAAVLEAMLSHAVDAFATPELQARAVRLAGYLKTRVRAAQRAA